VFSGIVHLTEEDELEKLPRFSISAHNAAVG